MKNDREIQPQVFVQLKKLRALFPGSIFPNDLSLQFDKLGFIHGIPSTIMLPLGDLGFPV